MRVLKSSVQNVATCRLQVPHALPAASCDTRKRQPWNNIGILRTPRALAENGVPKTLTKP